MSLARAACGGDEKLICFFLCEGEQISKMAVRDGSGAQGVYNTRDCSMNAVQPSNRMSKAGDTEDFWGDDLYLVTMNGIHLEQMGRIACYQFRRC